MKSMDFRSPLPLHWYRNNDTASARFTVGIDRSLELLIIS